jgi:hypothetical protein
LFFFEQTDIACCEDWRKPMSAWLGKIFYFAVRSCLACAS